MGGFPPVFPSQVRYQMPHPRQSHIVENVFLLNPANVTASTLESIEKALHKLFLQQAGNFSPIFDN